MDAVEIYNEGYYYYTGTEGYPMNYRLAFRKFTQAAEMGYAAAMNYLADMYLEGQGVTADQDLAIQWYQRAAAAGEPFALRKMAVRYYEGDGVSQDVGYAYELFRKALVMGDSLSAFFVAEAELEEKNYQEAFRLYKKAAEEADFPDAWYNVGCMIEQYPALTGANVLGRRRLAVAYYEKAAQKGHAQGMLLCGQRWYSLGERAKGKYWVGRAAEAGLPEAKKLNRLMMFAD